VTPSILTVTVPEIGLVGLKSAWKSPDEASNDTGDRVAGKISWRVKRPIQVPVCAVAGIALSTTHVNKSEVGLPVPIRVSPRFQMIKLTRGKAIKKTSNFCQILPLH
jgi:hypothetical protein